MSERRGGGRAAGKGAKASKGAKAPAGPKGQRAAAGRPGAPGAARGRGAPSGRDAGGGTGASSRSMGRPSGRSGASRPAAGRSAGRSGAGRPPGRAAAAKERGLGGTQVEGRQAVRELLLGGDRRVFEITLSAEVDRSDIIGDICDLAAEMRIPVTEVSRSKLDSLSHTEAPQGIIARAAELAESTLEDLCEPNDDGAPPFLLAVDGVTDPGNLGALLRIAECAGVTGVVLPRHRAVHVTPTVTKTAAGAIEHLPMALVGGLPTAIETMKARDVWVVGLDAGGETSIHDLALSDSGVCLVLGAEGKGLSRLVRQRCDLIASIPLHGRLGSLNVASAGAVACYEIARRRHGS